MGWKETAGPVLTRIPGVRRPAGHVPFRRKLTWTGGILVLYFFLTNITLFGLGGEAQNLYGQSFEAILAANQGTLMQLGIGPIVTASIVLQLLQGADLLGLDTNQPRDQMIYQGLQKALVVVMVVLTGLPMVFLGGFLPAADILGLPELAVKWIMFAQVAAGGILILYMDEVVSKWGVGSGIGLFIVAGVSQSLIGGFIFWGGASGEAGFFPTWIGIALGSVEVPRLLSPAGIQFLLFDQNAGLIALVTTVLIFAIVVYAESVRVEIPLSHAQVKGARGRFPVKLIYASVLPMILVRALQANIQFAGRILNATWQIPAWLGTYNNGQPTGGLFYYFAPVYSPGDWMWWLGTGSASAHPPWEVLLRLGIDLTFMIVGGAIFAIFWVETADMGPEATAQQIKNSGMRLPGFRDNESVIEKVMERYIPQVTVIGGALVGLLAVMANMMGTIGGVTGTGLLLAISITYKLYEEIAEEQLMEMHPMMREMFG